MSGFLIGAVLLACGPGAAPLDLARWDGRYVIDRAASDEGLGRRARRAAQGREIPPAPAWVRLEHDSVSVRATTERGLRWRVCGDGTVESERLDDGPDARAQLGDTTLALTATGRRGARRLEQVTLHDAGERLTIRIRVEADRLREPLEYRLVYRRSG